MVRPGWFAIALTALLTGVAPGQPQPGDLILSDMAAPHQDIVVLNRGTGKFTTLSPQTIEYPTRVIMAKNNVDLVVTLASRLANTTWLANLTPMGRYTSLSLGGFWHNPEAVALHENGSEYVVGMVWANALWRVNMTTQNTITSCTIQNLAALLTLARDHDTGDWLVGGNGGLHFVNEMTSAQTPIGTFAGRVDSLDPEPRTGNIVCADSFTPFIEVVDRYTGKIVTGFNMAPTFAVKVDDFTGHYYAAGYGTVIEYTPTGTPVNTWSLPQSTWTSVEVYGSRQISGRGLARPGTRYPIDFSFRGMGRAFYVGALAFTQRPGIPLSNGVINLTPDALFRASLAGAYVTGFSGILDDPGNATGYVSIPAFLPRGFTFYCGGMAILGSAFQVGNTIGITIR